MRQFQARWAARVNVHDKIYDAVGDPAHANVAVGANPVVDSYPLLRPRLGDNVNKQPKIAAEADDQPFPFYGWIDVAWR